MKKNDFAFIFIVSLIAGIIWIAVELLMIKLQFPRHFYIIWRISVVVVSCGITVWHGFKEEDESVKARQEKYNRKNRRKD